MWPQYRCEICGGWVEIPAYQSKPVHITRELDEDHDPEPIKRDQFRHLSSANVARLIRPAAQNAASIMEKSA